jgi:hypothetical protein
MGVARTKDEIVRCGERNDQDDRRCTKCFQRTSYPILLVRYVPNQKANEIDSPYHRDENRGSKTPSSFFLGGRWWWSNIDGSGLRFFWYLWYLWWGCDHRNVDNDVATYWTHDLVVFVDIVFDI